MPSGVSCRPDSGSADRDHAVLGRNRAVWGDGVMRGRGPSVAVALLSGLLSVFLSGGATVVAAAQNDAAPDTLGQSPTLSGLSGLVATVSARTLPPWTVAVGGDALYSHLFSPGADHYEGRVSVGIGLPKRVELAALLPAVHTVNDHGIPELPPTGTGVGDLQLAAKWRALYDDEALWPTLAVAAVVTLPTGQQSKGLRTVDDYGVELKVITSAEIEFIPHRFGLGLYGNAGYFFQDLGKNTEEKHATYAAGAALPVVMRAENYWSSPLQFLLEVNGTYLLEDDQDYVTVTPSLRYVGPIFDIPVTVTGGVQYTAYAHSTIGGGVGGVVQVGLVFR
jgi:hypothetical protein